MKHCGLVGFLKGGETPRQPRGGLFAMSINVHVFRSPRAPAIDLRALGLDAPARQRHYYSDDPEVERLIYAVTE